MPGPGLTTLPIIRVRAVKGVHNYTCDAAAGAYQFRGWIVNGTDVRNDKHTGAAAQCSPALHSTRRDLHHQATCGANAYPPHTCARHPTCAASAAWAAGYSFTERGPSGTHFSRFVATDEANSTQLGSVEIIREVGSIGMPRWVLVWRFRCSTDRR